MMQLHHWLCRKCILLLFPARPGLNHSRSFIVCRTLVLHLQRNDKGDDASKHVTTYVILGVLSVLVVLLVVFTMMKLCR